MVCPWQCKSGAVPHSGPSTSSSGSAGVEGANRAGTIPAVMASIKPTLFSHSSPSLTCWRMSITGLEGLGEVRGGRTG